MSFNPVNKILGKKLVKDVYGKNKELTEIKVSEEKMCDICGEPALYDGRTKTGAWAYMCHKCMSLHGVGLGTGKGQRLIVEKR